jgi:16S rRNA G966 N2-methylase RsmD
MKNANKEKSEVRSELIKKRGYRNDVYGDTLSLYLSNYPISAKWLANRIGNKSKVALELCCAVGITMEYLAPVFKKVIGIDIDKKILNACKKNLKSVGVSKKTKLILGDIRDKKLLKKIKADIVIYDIPYWYPQKYSLYTKKKIKVENPNLKETIKNIREFISKDIVVFTPPEMDYKYFKGVAGQCECVKININNRSDRNYFFLGNLIKKEGINKLKLNF